MPTNGLDGGIDTLQIQGVSVASNVASAIIGCDLDRVIDGAATMTLTLRDKDRILLRSGIANARITCQFGGLSFASAKIGKSGNDLKIVFEDIIINALRQHYDPRKVAAGSMSRVDFVRLLCGEEPWIKVYVPPGVGIGLAQEELARGTPDTPPTPDVLAQRTVDPHAGMEDSWTAIKRIMDGIGWRAFSDGSQLWLTPDTYLIAQTPLATISEDTIGVDVIDFDWDEGKPIAQATVTCRAGMWDFPPGGVIALAKSGPANGPWIISEIARSAFKPDATITLVKQNPVLPEPIQAQVSPVDTTSVDASTTPGDTALTDGTEGLPDPTTPKAGQVAIPLVPSALGYLWPTKVKGSILSGFGKRNGKQHDGLDIAVPLKTPVLATRDGTVTFAGTSPDYGKFVVTVAHAGGVFTRYGFLDSLSVKAGVIVHQRDQLGLSGGLTTETGAGKATGAHLHFEVRPNDKPDDPLKYVGDLVRSSDAEIIRLGRFN